MIPAARILYPHAWFSPEGAVAATPGALTVSSSVKPLTNSVDASADSLWLSLGRLANVTEEPSTGTTVDIWTGSPGKLVLGDQIATKAKLALTASCQELNEVGLAALYQTASLGLATATNNKQFNPLEGAIIRKGWLKVQYYDHNNVLVMTVDRWGGLTFSGSYTADGENMEYSLKFETYHSIYNTGVILPT